MNDEDNEKDLDLNLTDVSKLQQSLCISLEHLFFARIRYLHRVNGVDGLSYRDVTISNVIGHIRAEEDVVFPKEFVGAHEGGRISIKGCICIKFTEIVDGMFCQPGEVIRTQPL